MFLVFDFLKNRKSGNTYSELIKSTDVSKFVKKIAEKLIWQAYFDCNP